MATAIFKVLLKFIASLVGLILTPIDLVISALFPSVNDYISTLIALLANVFSRITPYIYWITHLIPPATFASIQAFIYVSIAIYTATISIHAIIKIFKIIQNIKIW